MRQEQIKQDRKELYNEQREDVTNSAGGGRPYGVVYHHDLRAGQNTYMPKTAIGAKRRMRSIGHGNMTRCRRQRPPREVNDVH